MADDWTEEQGNTAAENAAISAHMRSRSWNDAYQGFRELHRFGELVPDQLEQFGTAAYLTGREEEFLNIFALAFEAQANDGNHQRAARCAFWLGLTYMFRGEFGLGGGWFSKANRVLDEQGMTCAETGYLILPQVEQCLSAGEFAKARDLAHQAVGIGTKYGDGELLTIARHQLGRIELDTGNLTQGFALLDEVMLAVISDRFWPVTTGLIFCSVIDACQSVLDYGRTREWTNALSNWCAEQPQMLAFTGRCMIHRSESRYLTGDWTHAEHEANFACRTLAGSPGAHHAGAAHYQLGEIHRLRGNFQAAEASYIDASRCGQDPQPGLSIMRLQQGQASVASSGLRRALAGTTLPTKRIRLLLPLTEVMIATGDIAAARECAGELSEHASNYPTQAVQAMARQASGLVDLARNKLDDAITEFQAAADIWQQLDASHHTAVARVLVGRACAALGDTEGALLHLRAARSIFETLRAQPDLDRVEQLLGALQSPKAQVLTSRQIGVIRRVAEGKTNREIADEFRLSERTVDRHVSNILMRLDVPNRSAAVKYAITHGLVKD